MTSSLGRSSTSFNTQQQAELLPVQASAAHFEGVPAGRPATVLVADPGGVIGEVLRYALMEFAGFRIVEASSVADVDAMIARGVIGEVAMVSVRFNGSTAGLIRSLRAAGWPRVIALTLPSVPIGPVIAAVQAGAGGVLSIPGIIDPIPDEGNPARQLSGRELEVIRLVADGWSNKSIGLQLSLSSLTVKNHLARIGRKLGVGDRAQMVAIACRAGLIPLASPGGRMT
jgi:DNA-binding CsgD family transcriptional regulator